MRSDFVFSVHLCMRPWATALDKAVSQRKWSNIRAASTQHGELLRPGHTRRNPKLDFAVGWVLPGKASQRT